MEVEAVPESFERFYEREYRGVLGLALALSRGPGSAEDLAQEAFLAAHRQWDRIARYERPEAWVRRVVANLAASRFRRAVAEARALARLAAGRRPRVPPLTGDDALFWDAVRSLPRRQAQAVALHYLEDLSVAEVAKVLGLAEGTVKAHLCRGRRTLARRLGLAEEE